MVLLIFGSPGAGKGTQAKALAGELGLPHICSGDLLREVLRAGSALGRKISAFVEKGELVPDDLVNQLIMERLSQPDARNGFILDGYPRNLRQAAELDKMLLGLKQQIDSVVHLEASEGVILKRLTGRRLCPNCQANFHIKNMPPKKEGICDYCGASLYQRPDDNEGTIKNRLKVYRQTTSPLIDYYRQRGILLSITADEEADVVLEEILNALKIKR